MTHLRTDLPLIPDEEMDEWVKDIWRTRITLRQKLDEAFHFHDTGVTPAASH